MQDFNIRWSFEIVYSIFCDFKLPDLLIPSIQVLADHIDRYIWPGAMPSTVENNVKIMLEDIFYNDKDIEAALKDAEAAINEDLEYSDFVSQEPMYKFASEAIG